MTIIQPKRAFGVSIVLTLVAQALSGATPVLTRAYDNGRTGANVTETTFTTAAVSQGLKKLTLDMPGDDPRIEAQPLYVPGIAMSDGQTHDVLYVFTMSNNVWAFDANTGARIWQNPVNLGPAFVPPASFQNGHRTTTIDLYGINIKWGILSTPVIDRDAQTLYMVNWAVENGKRALRLHALALADGKDRKPPIAITGSMKNAAGATVTLSQDQKQRAALLLVPLNGTAVPPARKTLFAGFTGGERPGDPRSWVVAFDVDQFRQTASWSGAPNSWGAGLWNGSQGPAADDRGNIYFTTGNGGWDGKLDFAESFVKLQYKPGPQAKLTVADFFTPFLDTARRTFPGYDYKDQDLGSGAPILPPNTDFVVGAGKDGVLYVLNRNNMGHRDFSKLKSVPIFFTYFPGFGVSATGSLDFDPVQGVKTHHLHGSPIYWNSQDHGPMLYVWGENETLRAWTLDASGKAAFFGKSAEVSSARLANPQMPGTGGMPGGMLTVSANGGQNGIVWATAPIDGDANKNVAEGIVRAYDASTLDTNKNADGTARLKLLWDSQRIPGNRFAYSKFCTPLVADGKLFVPTYGSWPDSAGNHARIDLYTLK